MEIKNKIILETISNQEFNKKKSFQINKIYNLKMIIKLTIWKRIFKLTIWKEKSFQIFQERWKGI